MLHNKCNINPFKKHYTQKTVYSEI